MQSLPFPLADPRTQAGLVDFQSKAIPDFRFYEDEYYICDKEFQTARLYLFYCFSIVSLVLGRKRGTSKKVDFYLKILEQDNFASS